MDSQIWITGYGIVSAIGVGKEATLRSLLASETGIAPLRYLKTEHHEFPVGEVKLSDEEMMEMVGADPKKPHNRTALMGILALREALEDAGLGREALPSTGLISGTTVGGMDMSEQYYLDFLNNDNRNEYIRTHDCGATTELTGDPCGRFAFMTTISTACSSAANAVILGANMIRCGETECVVVGGSECITKFHLNGFNSLMILDKEACKPFDNRRAGLNLGEGAAYLVLETRRHAEARGARAVALLSGYGNACDAFHQTASSPDGEGAFRAMRQALQMAGVKAEEIDYINAHGTGTRNNDSSESAAIRRIWQGTVPPVSSTKAFTGHTTSASGSIETAICMLAMQHGFLPPNLHYGETDPECIVPVATLRKGVALRHVLCNSFGFGGNDSSLLISAVGGEQSSVGREQSKRRVAVYSAAYVSAQQGEGIEMLCAATPLAESYQRAADPDFKAYIPPLEARRMGKLLKRAIVTSQQALSGAGIEEPDAIVTGTGLGCIENTEYFLDSLCNEGEQLLKPTYFMQSTHNTIGSQVASRLHCHGYNITYAHKEISFDSALHDAFVQIGLGHIENALVGGHDELTPSYYRLLVKSGFLGQEGSPACEASSSFVLAAEGSMQGEPLCRVAGVRLLYTPDEELLGKAIDEMLAAEGIGRERLSGVMVSVNGNAEHDRAVLEQCRRLFGDTPLLHYKHLFGESFSASGMGFYAAVEILSSGRIPPSLYLDGERPVEDVPQTLLHVNLADGKSVALTLLTK